MNTEFKISEITINVKGNSNIILREKGKTISLDTPIFKKINNNEKETVPAAFRVDDTNVELTVTVSIPDGAASNNYKLECWYYNGIIFSSESGITPKDNIIKFTVKSRSVPDRFARIKGERLSWRIFNSKPEGNPLPTIDLELYWLYDDANDIYRGRGISVEVLRELTQSRWFSEDIPINKPAPYYGRKSDRESISDVAKQFIIQSVVNFCFFRNPPYYDIWGGHRGFTTSTDGNNFILSLTDYLNVIRSEKETCNCEDQAAILQIFLKSIGILNVKFCQLSPFGYMKKSNLIGWGVCNNPIFTKTQSSQVLGVLDPDREDFDFHTFCFLEEYNWILDSCIGPHTGGENPHSYIENAIDNEFHRPQQDKPMVFPCECKIKKIEGVTCIDFMCAAKKTPSIEIPLNKKFIERFKINDNAMRDKKNEFVVYNWGGKKNVRKLFGTGFLLSSKDPIPGYNEVLKAWKLSKGNMWVSIKLYITSGENANDYALNRFFSLGLSDPLPDKGPDYLGEHSASFDSESRKRRFWRVNNVVFDIQFVNADEKIVESFCKALNQLAIKNIKDQKNPQYLGEDDSITISDNEIEIGKIVTVTNKKQGDEIYDFYLTGGGMRFKAEKDIEGNHDIEFETVISSENTLVIAAVDKATLLVRNKEFTIKVVGGNNLKKPANKGGKKQRQRKKR